MILPVTIAAVGEAQPSFEDVVNRLRAKFTWRIWSDDISETLDDAQIRLIEGWCEITARDIRIIDFAPSRYLDQVSRSRLTVFGHSFIQRWPGNEDTKSQQSDVFLSSIG